MIAQRLLERFHAWRETKRGCGRPGCVDRVVRKAFNGGVT